MVCVFADMLSTANPDGVRFPSATAGVGAADCKCDTRNCTIPTSTDCTDPVCICKAGTRSLRPFAEFLNGLGLRLGLWTWRGVHRMAAVHKLKVKGTNYTIDQIVDQNKDGTPCLTGRCSGQCPWGPWLGVNASHPGAQPFYDSLYELFIAEWKVEFVKADCEDSTRLGETLAQTNAVKKQPLIPGVVTGSTKPRTMALSLSPGTFGPVVESGQWIAQNQAATMYRVTTDFWGGQGQVFGGLAGGGGSIARASLHANASLLGNQANSNGTYPDLVRIGCTCTCFFALRTIDAIGAGMEQDMLPIGQIRCGLATVQHPMCSCDNCEGGGMAHTIAAVWAIANSPLLFGGALPADGPTLALLTNKDFLFVHSNARNQQVIEYTQANLTCGPRTVPKCDWMAHGWTKWSADLRPAQMDSSALHVNSLQGGGGYGGRGWPLPPRATGTMDTASNPPLKAVLLVNVGHPQDTYPLPGPWDGPNSTKNQWGPSGRLTHTTWESLGLPPAHVTGSGYTAKDVFTQEQLHANATGFTANVTGFNATLVLVQRAK
jgi:hypothetical protein